MRTPWVAASILALAALSVTWAPRAQAQSADRAEASLQAAQHAELVEGDLERAIRMYRDIARTQASNRSVAARALVYLGRAYEKLGDAQARAAYERVVREYGDQAEPVRVARERLRTFTASRSAGNGASREPTYTMVLGELPPLREADAPQFDFSPRGDRIVFVERVGAGDTLRRRRLVIAEQSGTVVRTLAEREGPGFLISPRWSPDGRHILYLQGRSGPGDSVTSALLLVPAGGGAPRTVATFGPGDRAPAALARGGLFWQPDGQAFTFATRNTLETMDLEGRTVRSVPFRMPYLTQFTGYSPDGRWLAFHEVNEGSEQQRETDVWILPAEGGRAIQLTHAVGTDAWPMWAPDGRSVYFVSERGGSANVWRQDVDPQSGLPRGEAQQVTSYTDVTVMYPKPVDGGRRLAFALVRQTSVVHVAPSSRPAESRAVARGASHQLSPDGRVLYYEGQGTGQEGIWAVALDGGEPRRLSQTTPGGPAFQTFFLAPDGRAIGYFSQIGAQNRLFVVPTAGGEPRELIRFDSREHLVPSWSPDGSQLAYSHGNALYAIAAAGGEPRRLAELYSWDGWTVRWSPDGRQIAALAWTAPETPTQSNAVFVVPASGGEPRRLTPPEENEYKEVLEWHPDGQRLTYMYYQHGNGDGTRMAFLDGRPTALLVDQPAPQWDYVGNWSPDGRRYYFISSARSNSWGLFAYDDSTRSTSVVVPDTVGNPGVGLPSFSRDGRIMAYDVRGTTRQLWVMDVR